MTTPRHVAVLVGSLRRQSLHRKLARRAVERADTSRALELLLLGELPLYNRFLEEVMPQLWAAFRGRVRSDDGEHGEHGEDGGPFFVPEVDRPGPDVRRPRHPIGALGAIHRL